MFTGRIVEVGTVVDAGVQLAIEAPKTAAELAQGGSVCVSGVCFSVVEVHRDQVRVDVSVETARRATATELRVGARVNLELPLRLGDQLDGHLVQGHVDAVGKVTKVDAEGGSGRRVWIRPPERFLHEIVPKGSVAVEGVSLTVAEVVRDRFSVALIPLTVAATTLGDLRDGDRVNLESDVVAKAAGEVHEAARLVVNRTFAALPWAGELRGPAGVQKAAAQLAAGGGVVIFDPDREGEADVVFAGTGLRPDAFVFLLTQACGHTTVPCDPARLEGLEIPPMPGAGDRHGTSYHVSVDPPPARVPACPRTSGRQRCGDSLPLMPGRRTSCARVMSFRSPVALEDSPSGVAIRRRPWRCARRQAFRPSLSSVRSWAPTVTCSPSEPSNGSRCDADNRW